MTPKEWEEWSRRMWGHSDDGVLEEADKIIEELYPRLVANTATPEPDVVIQTAARGISYTLVVKESASVKTTVGRDHLSVVEFVPPASVRLTFADGLSGKWSFSDLELDMSSVRPTTMRVAASGTAIEVKSPRGQSVIIDAAPLRALVDPAYAEEMRQAYLKLLGPYERLNSIVVNKKPRK